MSIITNEERNYLLNNIKELFEEYEYCYTNYALETIIDTWTNNKKDLIESFRKHPNYVDGKFMIAFKQGFQRVQNPNELLNFIHYVTGFMLAHFSEMPSDIKADRDSGYLFKPNVYNAIFDFSSYTSATIDNDIAQIFEAEIPSLHIKTGQKTSRAVNKICTYLGVTKDPEYNRKFARYADAINPLTVNYNIVLSINPLDYLTMSFGNSWSSCHTIDTHNKRDMPSGYHGMYSSGTVSYMLDQSSMVLYTVDEKYSGTEYWNEPKINRQMFHYAGNKLIQSRLYPQGNDGDGNAYRPYRNIVQEIIAKIKDMPNLWVNKKGTNEIYPYTDSRGTHYRDYRNFDSCNISFAKDKDTNGNIVIGHDPICVECGCEHQYEDTINCCNRSNLQCACCGYDIDEDDAYYVEGVAYCNECVTYCECCDEYVLNDSAHWIEREQIYVCDSCFDNGYVWCTHCREYVHKDIATYVDGNYVCDDCLDAYCTECEVCGEYHEDRNITLYNDMDLCPDCLKKEKEKENNN